jgi:hypothetical protein
MSIPTLALVGGFLGAGKTTLLLRAARELQAQGLRPALILNDQAAGLVDTGFAAASGIPAEEVPGGCFCCRFTDLLLAAQRLAPHSPDIILAEPVGSCIDLSATILQPLKQDFPHLFRLAPFTVLIDGALTDLSPDAAYLHRNQIAEADLLCRSKSDLGPASIPWPIDFHLSARSGEGVLAWLHALLDPTSPAGTRLLPEVDYTRYAEAEAALGWLNYSVDLQMRPALNPPMLVGPFLEDLDAALTRAGARIAHLKILDRAPTGFLKASLCRNNQEPQTDGDLTASAAAHHSLTLNLRAEADPALLRTLVVEAAARLPGRRSNETLQAFRPAPPTPERILRG